MNKKFNWTGNIIFFKRLVKYIPIGNILLDTEQRAGLILKTQ